MRTTNTCQLLIASLILAFLSGTAEAKTYHYSKQVQRACVNDYKRHCGEYGVETSALRTCMKRVGKRLSKGCVNALVASGQVSRAGVKRRHGR
jgi:hypothetical protein